MKISLDRRVFLKTSATGVLGIAALCQLGLSSCAAVDRKSFGVGLQLYTIRVATAWVEEATATSNHTKR